LISFSLKYPCPRPQRQGLVGFRLFTFFVALAFCVAAFLEAAQAQPLRRPTNGKSLRGNGASASDAALYGFNLSSAVDKVLTDSASTDLYDPMTIQVLKRLRDEAVPKINPLDVEPDLSRRVAEKALAIQSGRSISRLVHESEIRGVYLEVLDSLRGIQDMFRYSVQDTGEKITVTKKRKGERLVELSLEFNLKQGIDPQLRLGDNVRFRYDYLEQSPLLEYTLSF
jgi:hypothetical protein